MLHLDCSSEQTWAAVYRDREDLAALDIGVTSIVVTRPDQTAFVIEMAVAQVP